MSKTFIWIGIAVVAIFALFFLGNSAPTLTPGLSESVIHPQDSIKGNPEAKVLVVEYSDFQCPACRTYYPIVRQLVSEFGDQIAVVYRHFPLTTIHFNAEFAARAAEAAKKQNKFWEMHDLLFEKQNEWSGSSNPSSMFESYAELIGLNVDQFKNDFSSKEVRDFVKAERAHSLKIGLQGTPTFFVNGQKIDNPNSLEGFKAVINSALQN